ncbi:type II secretion system F family protein [Geoglobus ahangari]
MYAPGFLKRRYSRKYLKNREKYEELEKALRSSRLPLTVYELLASSSFYSLLAFVLTTLLFSFVLAFPLHDVSTAFVNLVLDRLSGVSFYADRLISFLTPDAAEKLRLYMLEYYFLLSVIPGYVAYRLVKYLILSYPFFVRDRRKGEIDLYVPHAINMMYGMAVGGLSPVEIMREISKLEHLFGELSVEFREVLKNFEVFRKDIFTSLRYVRDTTPSRRLSAFLDSLIVVLQGGGSFSSYLKSKSEEYEEEQEITFSEATSFMEILFEIYISIFMMFPMLLLIVLVVSKFVSGNVMDGYVYLMYITLPLASAFIIMLAKSTLPFPKAEIRRVREEVHGTHVCIYDKPVRRYKFRRVKKALSSVFRLLTHPYTTPIAYMDMRIAAAHVLIFSAVVIFALTRYGYLRPEDYAIPAFIVFLALVAIVEVKHRIIRSAEEKLPEFFSELAMLNESGVSIFEGVRLVSKSGTDILSREFRNISRYIELGLPLTRSIARLSYRIRSEIFAKAIPIAVKALETNTSIKDAFTTVSRYVEAELNFRKRLKSSLMPYLAIVYMSVGVFLFVSYLLISRFLVVFSGMNVSVMGISATFDVELIRETFMKTVYLVSFLSGIIAGTISEMRVSGGLKHAFILTLMSYLAFTYFI